MFIYGSEVLMCCVLENMLIVWPSFKIAMFILKCLCFSKAVFNSWAVFKTQALEFLTEITRCSPIT